MKKILIAITLVLTLALAASAQIDDFLDIGDTTSETNHNAVGFGPTGGTPNDTTYGNRDRSDPVDNEGYSFPKDMKVVWEQGCAQGQNNATFTLIPVTGYFAGLLEIRYLDGLSNKDSWELYYWNGQQWVLLATVNDKLDSVETWETFNIDLTQYQLSGPINFKIEMIDPAWSGCGNWGQGAFSWVRLNENGVVPEFSAVAAGLALAGAATGFVLLRKRK